MNLLHSLLILLLVIPLGWVIIPLIFFLGNVGQKKSYLLVGSLRLLCAILVGTSLLHFVFSLQLTEDAIFFLGEWAPAKEALLPVALQSDSQGAYYLLLSDILLLVIMHFSSSYLQGDRGFTRFFVCLGLMRLGLGLVCLGATTDMFLIGWELVGLSSILLIAFFRSSSRAAENSVRVWACYKICDLALILAVGLIHESGHSMFWNHLHEKMNLDRQHELYLIALLLILSTLAKAGQFPFQWWIPRAMEGPSPSSAIFYGALSLHLGPFLLLRTYDLWHRFPEFPWIIGILGASTAYVATLSGRVTSNVKTQLAHAAVCQVGIIYIELALGYRWVAWIHITLHCLLRSRQFLRANTLLQEFQKNPRSLPRYGWEFRWNLLQHLPLSMEKKIYLWAQHGFFVELFFARCVEKFLEVVHFFYRRKRVLFLQGLFLVPGKNNQRRVLFLLRFGILQAIIALLFGWKQVGTEYYHLLCYVFPILAFFFSCFSLVTRWWSSCLYYTAQSFTQLYSLLLLHPESHCRWMGAICILIQITLMSYLQTVDIQLIHSRRRLLSVFGPHTLAIKKNPGVTFTLLLLLLGAPGSVAYFGQDTVGHLLLARVPIGIVCLALLASSFCFISVYQKYLGLYHGPKPVE
jgi:NADH-quinone oxidoreductase subunit L